MTQYAKATSVSPEKSMAEIQAILRRWKASGFLYGEKDEGAVIFFEMSNRRIKFQVAYPTRESYRDLKVGQRFIRKRTDIQVAEMRSQAIRQRWRALALAIKAKLESVETGITTFEHEFLPYMVLPGGKTAGEWLIPELDKVLAGRELPPLLGLGEGRGA